MRKKQMPFSRMLALAWRFSIREMRGGLSGFAIFLACIALGAGAIGGVNSVAQSITQGVTSEGKTLLGGDMRFQLNQRETTPDEAAWLNGLGHLSHSAEMRSMVRLLDGSDQSLAEIKAVDAAYPLIGALVTEPALPHSTLFETRDGVSGAAAEQLLLDRLDLKPGDHVRLGGSEFEIRAVIRNEPDLISGGFGFAPRLMVSVDALRLSGLIQPGSLVEHNYKIDLQTNAVSSRIAEARGEAASLFPEAGWSIRDSANAAPALASNVERFSQFLMLVGLTALVVGGVGVANAVRSYLETKRSVIATFKCLGASGRFVFTVYFVQILMIATLGILIGLVIAALMPLVAGQLIGAVIPVPVTGGFYPMALLQAAVFGFLVTIAFALLPLGRARDVQATSLFRENSLDGRGLPRAPYVIAAGITLVLLAALAVWFSHSRALAIGFLASVAAAFLVLRLVSLGVQALARRAPVVRSTPLRLAIGNIHRKGALTPSVVLSLGLGLTLLVSLALIDGNLRRQITGNLPEQAPNFFFVDIQSNEVDRFAELVSNESGGKLVRVPMLRGRIIALNDVDVAKVDVPPEGAWVLRGDRGLTYSSRLPENSRLVEGEWWPEDYAGDPLVSFAAEEGAELGLKLGDTVTVNVLGRNVTARIANFRDVAWESMGINFVMVFSPNTLAGAPHAWLATLTDTQASEQQEADILNTITRAFPAVTSVRVKDALDVVNRVVEQLALAIRAAASVALIASVLVLSGALAASNRARVHDAVVLKMLGATRRDLIAAFSLEYAMIGLATAVFALIAGSVASWVVITSIMNLQSAFLPDVALTTLVLALVLTVGFGLIGTWRVLGHKAAPVLRTL